MQKLTISNLGPIKKCDIEIKDFLVFTGPQASGKSTVAKSIFFFDNLKNVLFALCQKQMPAKPLFESGTLEELLQREIKRAFMQAFDVTSDVESYGRIDYTYDNGGMVIIHYEPSDEDLSLLVTFDDTIKSRLLLLEQKLGGAARGDADQIRRFICGEVFASEMDVIYIPAGRSLHTMLSAQINYLYSVMDDLQKSTLDYCTQCYIEEIFRIKEFFDRTPEQLAKHVSNSVGYSVEKEKLESAIALMKNILQGEYRNINGTERLYYEHGRSVKLSQASSGQQEAVWITNTLFYHMLGQRPARFIIEEPESHLFPNAQKLMTEFIALVKNGKNSIVLTTHSPYVLGSINNLLYANFLSDQVDKEKLSEIIDPKLWIDYDAFGAYFLEKGYPEDIKDAEIENINHDVIDGASLDINEDFEKMVELKFETEGGAE